jgi:hypothetical protein
MCCEEEMNSLLYVDRCMYIVAGSLIFGGNDNDVNGMLMK